MLVPFPALDLLLTTARTGSVRGLVRDEAGLEQWNRMLDSTLVADRTGGAGSGAGPVEDPCRGQRSFVAAAASALPLFFQIS